MFSGSIKWENWVLAIANIPLKLILANFLFYTSSKHNETRGFQGVQNGNIDQKRVNLLFSCYSVDLNIIFLKGIPDLHPFLRHPSRDQACPFFFKIFASPPLFSVSPSIKVFQAVSPTLTQPPPALIHNTPTSLTHN